MLPTFSWTLVTPNLMCVRGSIEITRTLKDFNPPEPIPWEVVYSSSHGLSDSLARPHLALITYTLP